MKRLCVLIAMTIASAAHAQTPTATSHPKPFACPAGAAGKDLLYFRGTSMAPDQSNGLHRVIVRYPPVPRCGDEPPLEGLAQDGGGVVIPPTYASVAPFSTTLAIARRTDGRNVFIDIATKAEKPFPYIRYLRVGDVGGFGIVSDDPATQTSRVAMLSRATGEPLATFDQIIGSIDTEWIGTFDWRIKGAPLRQRTSEGKERVLWVNSTGAINRETPPVTELRSGNSRELVEVLGPSPFPAMWSEMYVPLQSTGYRWPLPESVLGFAPHPLNPGQQVAFVKRGDKTQIYTGSTMFFSFPDNRRNWNVSTDPVFYFDDMAVVTPKQQPVAEYKADRFLVVRTSGSSGWKPLKMELPDPGFTRATPQAALDEAIIAYNARMAAGGLAELNARKAAEKAAADVALAKWQAERNAEEERYQALVRKAATPNATFTDADVRFAFQHEASTFNTAFRLAVPRQWTRYQGMKIADDLRKLGGQAGEASIYDAERRARDAGPEALKAFALAYPVKDPQSKVLLCDGGDNYHCYKPPVDSSVYESAGYDGNAALASSAASNEAFKARERAINTSNCARASMGAIIGCNQ